MAQVIHTPHDHIPNFAASPTIRSAADGPWSSASTWTPARVPRASDVVRITHAVSYDSLAGDADVIGIEAGGALRFATDVSTRLRVAILLVLADGHLEIGTPPDPVAPTVTAELVIKDKPLNTANDPDQFGTGLLSIDGTVTMHGAIKTPTFVRTAVEPLEGQTSVTLEQPVSEWRVGDRVFLPDTRQVPADHWFNPSWPLHVEERTIQAISDDGRTLTLSSALRFDHRGARDADGTPTVLTDGTRLLPHVGNLTRNVVIRSENPAGTRGHTLYTHRSDVRIAYVQFQDLGRTRAAPLHASTNHIGRYPIHIHHVWGPVNPANTGYQFSLVGNAVNDSLKWPIAVHGSHYGLVKQNVVFGGSQLTGAGIAIEDGTETENLFEENFVANIRGNTHPRNSGPGTADGTTAGSAGECFWAAGFNNRYVGNVAASCRNTVQEIVSGPGWKFIVPPAPYSARNPRFRGAEMTDSDHTVSVTPQDQPVLEFRGNEVYGLAADGLTLWQLGTDGYGIQPPVMGETLIKDFRVWHTYEGAAYNYPANRVTFDGLVYRIDPAATQYWPAAVQCGDYRQIAITIRGGSIHAGSVFGNCTDPLGTYTLENVTAVTHDHAFDLQTPATPGTQADRPPSGVQMVLKNTRISPWPGRPLQTISLHHTTAKANSQPNDPYTVVVYDYQGQAGNNFRAYFGVQATQNLYGGLAPCNDTTSRPEINGITCPISGPAPTSMLTASPPTGGAGRTATPSRTTTNAPSVSESASGLAGDFNGDNVADVLTYSPATGAWSVAITGQTISSGTWPPGLVLHGTNVDGDSLTDVFGYDPSSGRWMNAVNAGTSWSTTTGAWWPGWEVYVLDPDGAGAHQVFFGRGAGRLIPVVAMAGPSSVRPWLSPDGRRLYYATRRLSASARFDLVMATRPSDAAPFGAPTPLASLNSRASSIGPTLTADELTIFFASDAPRGPGGFDIWGATRDSRHAPFDAPVRLDALNSPADDWNPEISPDGETVFLESTRPGGLGGADIWAAARDGRTRAFAPPTNFSSINTPMNDGHPAVTGDTMHLYFGSSRPGGADSAYTWRSPLICEGVSPRNLTLPSQGGAAAIAIADASSCEWVALSPQSWIAITSVPSGRGAGTVTFSAPVNTGTTRTGTIRVGGTTVIVTQLGRP